MDSKALQYVKKLGPLIGLILLFVINSVMNDSFLEFSKLRNLLRQVSINAIIAGVAKTANEPLPRASAVLFSLTVISSCPLIPFSNMFLK